MSTIRSRSYHLVSNKLAAQKNERLRSVWLMSMRLPKSERQQRLSELLADDPLLTDEDLGKLLGVSVQTIRLDRLELGIPEMRVRAREIAQRAQAKIRSLGPTEVTGELIDVELGARGVSVMETSPEMGFKRSGIVRGHHLFAQGNSLAVSLIDAEAALTGSATLTFHQPVRVGARVVARAEVQERKDRKTVVVVTSRVGGNIVFSGRFTIFAIDGREEAGMLR